MVKINKLNPNPGVTMLAKLEFMNPGGSIKDRIGFYMVKRAIEEGKLAKGGTVVEATGAGNTGIGIALAASMYGFSCVLVLPDKVSEEKRNLLRSYGARIVIAPTAVPPDDPRSYYRVADRLAKEIPGAYQPDQYSNPANPQAHYEATGPEIWRDTDGKVTHVIVGMGTGGTISGIGKYLKEKNPSIRIIGVDHVGSVLQEYFQNGNVTKGSKSYLTEGIGEDFIPQTTDFSVIDEISQVEDKESFLMARRLAREEGILAGGTSGSALVVARKIAKKTKKGIVVVVLPDSGRSYLSKFYNDEWMRDFGLLDEPIDTIAPLLNKKLHFISVASGASPQEAIRIMQHHLISQMPVLVGKRVVGTISEAILLEKLYGTGKIPVTVGEIMDTEVVQLPLETSISHLANALVKKEMVVIVDKSSAPVDVVTRIDLLSAMTKT